MYNFVVILAPTEPRNLTCENVNPTEILLTWKQPEYIYGPIGAFEGLIKYIENGKERQRNDFLFPYPMKREWRLQVTPFMNYTVGVREAAGAEKWGPYSKPCSLKTLEGGISFFVNDDNNNSLASRRELWGAGSHVKNSQGTWKQI